MALKSRFLALLLGYLLVMSREFIVILYCDSADVSNDLVRFSANGYIKRLLSSYLIVFLKS